LLQRLPSAPGNAQDFPVPKDDGMVTMGERLHFSDLRDVHDRRAMNPHEAARVEL
jgi:hypothetical protein